MSNEIESCTSCNKPLCDELCMWGGPDAAEIYDMEQDSVTPLYTFGSKAGVEFNTWVFRSTQGARLYIVVTDRQSSDFEMHHAIGAFTTLTDAIIAIFSTHQEYDLIKKTELKSN